MVRQPRHDHVQRKGDGDGDGPCDGAGEQALGVRAEAERGREGPLEAVVHPEDDGAAGENAEHLGAVAAEVAAEALEAGDLLEAAVQT